MKSKLDLKNALKCYKSSVLNQGDIDAQNELGSYIVLKRRIIKKHLIIISNSFNNQIHH